MATNSNQATVKRKTIFNGPQGSSSGHGNTLFTTRNMVKIAVLSAVAIVLQMLEFGGIPFVMPWLKMDFSEMPALLASFGMGPLAGVFVGLIKNLFKLFYSGTGGVGEIANFILGAALVVPAGLIYKRYRNRKSAAVGLAVGVVLFCIAGILLNIFVLLPLYSTLWMGSVENMIAAAQSVIPSINSIYGVAILGTTPFNIFKGILLSLVTMLLYKPLSPILHK